MAKKLWKNVTEDEKMKMKQFVINNPPNTPLTPEYAASYLGVSTATLQKMRCQDINGIRFYKPRHRCIVYYKCDLDEHLTSQPSHRALRNIDNHLLVSIHWLASKLSGAIQPSVLFG